MQIHDEEDPLSETTPAGRRPTTPIHRLVRRNPAEDETVRLPMSVVALWRDSVDPDLGTLRLQLSLPENLEDDDTLTFLPKETS